MTSACRICLAKSAAFAQAALIASGEDDGTGKDYQFTPSPSYRHLSDIYEHKAHIHAQAAGSHGDDFHAHKPR